MLRSEHARECSVLARFTGRPGLAAVGGTDYARPIGVIMISDDGIRVLGVERKLGRVMKGWNVYRFIIVNIRPDKSSQGILKVASTSIIIII